MGTLAEEAFRRLTIGDTGLIVSLGEDDAPRRLGVRLDPRTEALVRIGALIALDAPPASFRCAVEDAQRVGVRGGQTVTRSGVDSKTTTTFGSAKGGSEETRSRGVPTVPSTLGIQACSAMRLPGVV